MTTRFHYSLVKKPPIPVVILDLVTPDGAALIPGLTGHLDTAADVTVIPLPYIGQLGLQPVGQLSAQGFGGHPYLLGVYQVRVEIHGVGGILVDAVGHTSEKFVLVGRDVLRYYRVTFDGPAGVTEFH
jgi:hypothetical protein